MQVRRVAQIQVEGQLLPDIRRSMFERAQSFVYLLFLLVKRFGLRVGFDLRAFGLLAAFALRRGVDFLAAFPGFLEALARAGFLRFGAAFLDRLWLTLAGKAASSSISSSSRQPWASRTAIMARKMSFHVSCFIMTAFGNIQPSQQICWKARVSLPLSS